MIKAGIIGGTSYTAGELIRLLINHPETDLPFIHSHSHAGRKITEVHAGLLGETDLTFTDTLPLDKIDVLFCCTSAGETKLFMQENPLPENLKVIDLSPDFRLKNHQNTFIYGLPELNRRATCSAQYVANPGSFATCITLGLLPLAKNLLLTGDISINAIAGSTCMEETLSDSRSYSWQTHNLSVFQPFRHPELTEIRESLEQLQSSFQADMQLLPYRANFPRGLFTTLVVKTKVALPEITRMYEEYYAKDSFVHIVSEPIDLKQVLNTNKCLLHLEKHDDKLLIVSCIDNLLKGASGQAVHNMNLLFNLEETVGLRLKPSAF